MADDTFNNDDDNLDNDLFSGFGDEDDDYDEEELEGGESDDSEPEFDSETGLLSGEAGSRLDLSDIHGGTLKPIGLSQEMRTSFIEYSMSVIVARALPDVRDGLKPVHRRILYAMLDSGVLPSKPHKKSAWTVGEVIGKYHPHGDAAVYDSMVRMAQDFSMRLPLVDGHGNFGSVDGDPPAAMRYTESRLAKPAMEMMRDLNDDTVDWQPNYDESIQEPSVLPSRYPNLLVNGSSGIAVGMATNIPPHNLGEAIDAVCLMIDNPDCTLDDILEVMPGPDFPTGAVIMGKEGIRDAYETGRGSITVRAKAHVEQMKGNRQRIVVTEIPYQVNKGTLQEKIAQLVNEKRIEGISDMRDETNRKGMRLVFDLKQGAIPQVVLNNLYKHSQLQTTFGAIDLALVDGVPRTLSMKEMIGYYIDHQIDVVTRRTVFRLEKAKRELHIKQGLLIAVDNIDEVVHIIRSSYNDDEVKTRLNERFGIDAIQAQAILEMRLRRLTGLERDKLVEEIAKLEADISYYEGLLADKSKLMDLIKQELNEIKEKFANPRRTVISTEAVDLDVEDLIADEDMVITITHAGYIKRLPVATYRSQKRGGKGVQGLSLKEEDVVEDLFIASTHDYILFFTNFGKVYRLKVHELPVGSRTSRGKALVNLLEFAEGEHPMAALTTRDFPNDEYLMFATRKGMVKKTAMSAYDRSRRDGMIAINLRDNDELVNVSRVKPGEKIILASSDGRAILFDESDVRPTGRDTSGVRGITLKGDAYMLGMEITSGLGDLFVITENGYGKRTPVSEYTEHKRGGQGVYTIQMTQKKGDLTAMKVVGPQHELMIMSKEGAVIRVKTPDISQLGRATQGVKIMNVADGDKVSSVARMVAKKPKAKAKVDENQSSLDLGVAPEEESVDVGGEELFDDTLIDDEE
jgi:DNA gyrase subunit A